MSCMSTFVWLKDLVANLSPQRVGFNSRPVHGLTAVVFVAPPLHSFIHLSPTLRNLGKWNRNWIKRIKKQGLPPKTGAICLVVVIVTLVTGPVKSKPVLAHSSMPLYFLRSKNLVGVQYDRVQRMESGMNADVEISIEYYDVIFVRQSYRWKCIKRFFFLPFMFAWNLLLEYSVWRVIKLQEV
jgi:hypothetical protein